MKVFGWLSSAIVVSVLLGIIAMTAHIFDLRLWFIIRRARGEIREIARQRCPNAKVFSQQGATRIDPRHVALWITTKTDKERDRLRSDQILYQQLCETMLRVGYPPDAVPLIHFVIESQETVDREYGGSWREAAEMP
jgi:hypothetical protein